MKFYNSKELLKAYITNRKLAKREQDPVKELKYENRANSIRYVLELNSPTLDIVRNHRRILSSDVEYLHTFGEYAPFVREFAGYEQIEIPNKKPYETKVDLGRLLLHTRNFYKQLKVKYYNNVYSIMADNDSILRMISNKKGRYSGIVVPLADNKSFFIKVETNGTMQDYVSFIHEFSHVNSALINPDHTSYNKSCLFEVDALLMEMIYLDFNNSKYDNEAIYSKIDIFNDYIYSARIVCEKMNLLAERSEKELRDKSYLEIYLMNKGYSDEEIKDILYTGIEEYYNYIYAYMVAIEIYFKYLEDKEKGLNLLEEVINLTCEKPSEYIDKITKLDINIGEHINAYRDKLIEGLVYGKKV